MTIATSDTSALARWDRLVRDRAIPGPILAAAPEAPFGFSPERFARHTAAVLAGPASARAAPALEVLPDGGTVLDVGVGTGSASLPLVPPAGRVIGVDVDERMLEEFLRIGRSTGAQVEAVAGAWPDAAPSVPAADVVVCHSVLYGVEALEPFAAALTAHARRRVVVVIPDRAWLAWMDDLWLRFHGLQRTPAPTAGDAVDALVEMGLDVHRIDERSEVFEGYASRADALAEARRRLCLPPERDAELADALGERLRERPGGWLAAPIEPGAAVTIWWDTAGG